MATTTVLFAVTGKGVFPADMLRHDQCWPADTTSAQFITSPNREPRYVGTKVRDVEQLRTVFLRTHSSWGTFGVSPARWASFGWGVRIERAYTDDGEDITAAMREQIARELQS